MDIKAHFARLAFTGGTLDRQSETRSDTIISQSLAEPSARLLVFCEGRAILGLRDGPVQALFAPSELSAFAPDESSVIHLGRAPDGSARLAVQSSLTADTLPDPFKAIDLRSLIVQGLVAGPLLGDVAYAAALLAWHGNARFCGRCSAPTTCAAAGAKRVCTGCGREHFPRTDPVAIMLAVRGDRCLLGRSPNFPPGMYSTLAGFIEPGETIEEAVRRETREESGIRIGAVTYLASQPWPFPHSLMIGCVGEAETDTINFDATELEDCRWFDRAEIGAMMDGTHPDGLTAPLKGAIARSLLAWWLDAA